MNFKFDELNPYLFFTFLTPLIKCRFIINNYLFLEFHKSLNISKLKIFVMLINQNQNFKQLIINFNILEI